MIKQWQAYILNNEANSSYKSMDYVQVICPKCEAINKIRVNHLKAKIKKLGFYECAICRNLKSIHIARAKFREKYGEINPFELQEVKDKIKETNLSKYGVSCPLKNKKIHAKGVIAAKSKESRSKAKATLKKNYGVDNLLELNRGKINSTLQNKKHQLKLDILPKIIKKLEANNTLSISDINFYQEFGVSYTTIIRWLREENQVDYIKSLCIEERLSKSILEIGAELSNFIEAHKVSALSERVKSHFNLCGPTIKKCLIAVGKESLIGRFKSAKEIEFYEFIKSLDASAIRNDRTLIAPKELDVYLPNRRIAFEFNGLYWHSELNQISNQHLIKRQLCENVGIKLFQINENEWDFKKDIVKSIIRAKLGIYSHKIYARKCEIKEVNKQQASTFLEENHLMGKYTGCKHIGLFYEAELVSILSFRKFKEGIDISRFCSLLNTSIVGGYSKLLKYVEENNNTATFIQSYVDLRYGTKDTLLKIGFELTEITLGWAWTDLTNTFNRLQCRANMDNQKLSQAAYAEELNWYKIFDAGQAKFIKKL